VVRGGPERMGTSANTSQAYTILEDNYQPLNNTLNIDLQLIAWLVRRQRALETARSRRQQNCVVWRDDTRRRTRRQTDSSRRRRLRVEQHAGLASALPRLLARAAKVMRCETQSSAE